MMMGSTLLLLLPSETAGDTQPSVDMRVHRSETKSQD